MKSEIFHSNFCRNSPVCFRKNSSNASGGSHTFDVDVRMVAATNQDLWRMVKERKFRADFTTG